MPKGTRHPKWPEVVEFVDALGVKLDKWQWLVLRASLLRKGGRWAAFTVGVCAPRQNGKDGILEVRELVGARILGEKLQIHSAHLADTSKEHFRRLDDLIDANAWLSKEVKHVWKTNGHEAIEFRDGTPDPVPYPDPGWWPWVVGVTDVFQRGDVHPGGELSVDPAGGVARSLTRSCGTWGRRSIRRSRRTVSRSRGFVTGR